MKGVRFAPSPTGRFHVGNLRTAWVSREWARALGEPWVVRFEDIDRPRVVMDAKAVQLADLSALGLVPDEVVTQSELGDRHWALFQQAAQSGQVYPCFCSRKEVREALEHAASAPHAPAAIYSGACRSTHAPSSSREPLAWRFREADPSGRDDFIVARAVLPATRESFAPAYHWACAIDDYDGRYRLLVRAQDLSIAAAPQRAIQRWMAGGAELRAPAIFHAALVVQDDGQRLEKRTRGVTLDEVGIEARELVALFQRSFDSALLESRLAPGDLIGERKSTLTLSELGITGSPSRDGKA